MTAVNINYLRLHNESNITTRSYNICLYTIYSHTCFAPQQTRCWRIPDESRATAEELKIMLAGIARMENYLAIIQNMPEQPQSNNSRPNTLSLLSTIMQQVVGDAYRWVGYLYSSTLSEQLCEFILLISGPTTENTSFCFAKCCHNNTVSNTYFRQASYKCGNSCIACNWGM